MSDFFNEYDEFLKKYGIQFIRQPGFSKSDMLICKVDPKVTTALPSLCNTPIDVKLLAFKLKAISELHQRVEKTRIRFDKARAFLDFLPALALIQAPIFKSLMLRKSQLEDFHTLAITLLKAIIESTDNTQCETLKLQIIQTLVTIEATSKEIISIYDRYQRQDNAPSSSSAPQGVGATAAVSAAVAMPAAPKVDTAAAAAGSGVAAAAASAEEVKTRRDYDESTRPGPAEQHLLLSSAARGVTRVAPPNSPTLTDDLLRADLTGGSSSPEVVSFASRHVRAHFPEAHNSGSGFGSGSSTPLLTPVTSPKQGARLAGR